MYNWVTWLYSRDWHSIVNQLYINKKRKKKDAIIIFKTISFSAKELCGTPCFPKFGNKIIKKAFGKYLTESQILLLCEGLDLLCLNQLNICLIPNLLFFFCFSSSKLIFCDWFHYRLN